MNLPLLSYAPLAPIDDNILSLSQISPVTELEANMQRALVYLLKHDRAREETKKAMLAQMVLQDIYCNCIQMQLAGKEKAGEKGSG